MDGRAREPPFSELNTSTANHTFMSPMACQHAQAPRFTCLVIAMSNQWVRKAAGHIAGDLSKVFLLSSGDGGGGEGCLRRGGRRYSTHWLASLQLLRHHSVTRDLTAGIPLPPLFLLHLIKGSHPLPPLFLLNLTKGKGSRKNICVTIFELIIGALVCVMTFC